MLGIFVLIEHQTLWNNGSLILANIYHDIRYYRGDSKWITRYNEAIWLSQNGKYTEAKFLLTPLLNDMSISKKAEVSELYGDLIYSSSWSIQDTLRMYERSLEFRASERVSKKIAYIKKMNPEKQLALTGSQSETSSGKTDSWSLEKNAKKEELIKTWEKRAEYLGNTIPWDTISRNELQKLIESAQSGSIEIVQDW